jgi:hypothetical protein
MIDRRVGNHTAVCFSPKADAANRMTRALFVKNGRRPGSTLDLARVICRRAKARDKNNLLTSFDA